MHLCSIRNEEYQSCRECFGLRQNCAHQSRKHTCSVPHVLDLVHPSGFIQLRVNATSEIGSTACRPVERDLNLLSMTPYSVSAADYCSTSITVVRYALYLSVLIYGFL